MRVQQQEEANRREHRLLLEQRAADKRYEEERRVAKLKAQVYQHWLQTKYPAELAEHCITAFKDMPKEQTRSLCDNVYRRYQAQEFQAFRVIEELWKWDKALTAQWCTPPLTIG